MESHLIALLLGLVEGLTEFLPISSTGHLILLVDLLGFEGPRGHVFEIVIQFGAILAVCWLYRQKLLGVACGLLAREQKSWRFVCNLALGFIPAAVLGLLFHDTIKTVLFAPSVVAVSLLVGGILILIIERFKPAPRYASTDDLPFLTALGVGFFQALAMIPGTSRSGATIMGALLCRVERKAATEFSFFLAIPTMFAASCYDLYKNWGGLQASDVSLFAVGFVAAFAAALLVVAAAIRFIGKHGFAPFAYYRIGLGALMLALIYG